MDLVILEKQAYEQMKNSIRELTELVIELSNKISGSGTNE